MFKTIYHVTNGPAVMYEIDARHALANFPEEWNLDGCSIPTMEPGQTRAVGDQRRPTR